MRIGINASFARKPNTGIGQATINFLRKLMEFPISNFQPCLPAGRFSNKSKISNYKFQKLEFVLYLEEDIDLKLPSNFHKKVFLPSWKRDDLIRKIWWEKYLLPKQVKKDKCDVLISLYQCPTIFKRSPFGKGSTPPWRGEGFEKRNNAKDFQIHPNPPFLKEGIKMRHIMLVHDLIPKLFPNYLNNFRKKIYWRLTEKAIAKTDKIIAVSRRTEKDLIQHLGIAPEKITTEYIDVDEIYKKKVSREKSKEVLKKYKLNPGYVYSGGGLEVRKNTEGVLRAYKILFERNKKEKFLKDFPKLVISGKLMPQLAPLVTDAEKLVKKLNLTKQVELLDFVPQEDLPVIYKNCLFFIYPSFYEGFGMPILEAMNQGKPVIASKRSSLPEVGRDSILYCEPGDPEDIAMVMKNVMLNKNLRDELSRRGKERAQNFSWDIFTEKLLNIIKNL